MPANENPYNTLLRQELRRVFLRTLALRIVSGLVSFLALASWIGLIVAIWSAATDAPPLWQTLVVSRAAVIVAVGLFAWFVIYPVIRMPGLRKLALEVESRKDLKDILAAGYEFSQTDEAAKRYSPELVREVIRQAVQSIGGLEVRFLFLTRKQLYLVPVAYAALAALIIFAVVSPDSIFTAGERIASPRKASAVDHTANLFASPGNVTVLSGTDVEVSALDFGGSRQPVSLAYNLEKGFWKTESTNRAEGVVQGDQVIHKYSYTFEDIRNSVSYYFESGGNRSPTYHIDVVHKPIITDLNVELEPPPYTGEPSQRLVDSGGNIQALEGTHVRVDARANNVLKAAWVRYNEGEQTQVDVVGRDFDFDFRALRDGTYSIILEDSLGHRTDEPLVYGVEVYQDSPPVLDVLKPGEDAALPRNLKIDVGFVASDDYGVERAAIFYRRGGDQRFTGKRVALGGEAGKKDVAAAFTWDLGDIKLYPGDFVEYFVQVADNNVVTGPGITKSKIFHITVPTMGELYEQVKEQDAERSDLFKEALDETKQLKEHMEKLSREFKKTEKLDWSQKKEIDKAISSQENVQEKLQQIEQSLDETLQSLSDNQMTSEEIGRKLEEISQLIKQIDSEKLNEYVEQLRKAMEELTPEQIQEALENLNVTAEEMLKNLERTEALLKKIQQEQRMEELVRKMQDILQAQDELMDKTADSNAADSGEMEDLAGEQSKLSKETGELDQDMAALDEMMDSEEFSKQMEEAQKELAEKNPSQKMSKAAEQLQQNQKQGAMQSQQQAMDDLVALFTRMAQMQAAMQAASQQRMADNLQRLAKSTLEISFKQEKFTNRLREKVSSDNVGDVREFAEEQRSYASAVEQIANQLDDMSKESLAVPQSLLALLGESLGSMQSSLLFLEQSKAFMSTASGTEAVGSLNKATMELLSACKNCSSSGGGAAQGSMMQQLLAGQQKMLQNSQELLSMRAAQEKLLQQRQAEIQRLAGEQRALQQLAEDIQKDLKQNRDEHVVGRMDKIVDEMKEVVRDLDSGEMDEETLRKEIKIVSRLLDAQRSVHSRDYEKKRVSTTAEDVYSDAAGIAAREQDPQLLREEIRRAMTLKAPGEFEDLIKLYFRALAEETPSAHTDE